MSTSNRKAAQAGEDIVLRAIFTDADGTLVDLDADPVVYIYDQSSTESDVEDDATAATYAGAAAGPLTTTRLSTGYYTVTYTIPTGVDGTFRDLWVGQLNSVAGYQMFSFEVSSGFEASTQPVGNNTMIIVNLSSDIQSTSGVALSEATLYYSTKYSPLYASPDLIRMHMGRWIDYIPDDTLALMAHRASKEADFLSRGCRRKGQNFKYALTQFTIFSAVWRCLMIPGQGSTPSGSSSGSKNLGDLKITNGTTSAGDSVPDWVYQDVKDKLDEWTRVVNACALIAPGQGFDPGFAVKGELDPDRRLAGRLWDNPANYPYGQPTVNAKTRRPGKRRATFGFHGRPIGPYWRR